MSEAKQATPHSVLIDQLMDSRVPKTEREHAARREIEMLRDALRGPAQAHRQWVEQQAVWRTMSQPDNLGLISRPVKRPLPSPEWIGLMEEERHRFINDFVLCCGVEPTSADINITGMYALLDQIEAKLKEKNHVAVD